MDNFDTRQIIVCLTASKYGHVLPVTLYGILDSYVAQICEVATQISDKKISQFEHIEDFVKRILELGFEAVMSEIRQSEEIDNQ